MAYERMSVDAYQPERLNFARHHTGLAPEPISGLRPLWPVFVGALVLILVGLILILGAGHAAAALGGLIFAFAGLALLGIAAYQMGGRP